MYTYIICQMTVFCLVPALNLVNLLTKSGTNLARQLLMSYSFFVPIKAVHTHPLKKSKY